MLQEAKSQTFFSPYFRHIELDTNSIIYNACIFTSKKMTDTEGKCPNSDKIPNTGPFNEPIGFRGMGQPVVCSAYQIAGFFSLKQMLFIML